VLEALMDDSIVIDNPGPGRVNGWMLRGEVRQEVLRAMTAREGPQSLARAQRAVQEALLKRLDARDDLRRSVQSDPLQRIYQAYLSRQVPPLSDQDLDELACTQLVVSWLSDLGLDLDLPTPDEVKRWIDWLNLIQPFRQLVGKQFRGRKRELATLRNYVEAYPPEGAFEVLGRAWRNFWNIRERPPLMIWGLGGIGKTSLVAKFVLEHIQPEGAARIPFVYLDFVRPALNPEEPATLLVEAFGQIGAQLPEVRARCEEARAQLAARLAARQGSRSVLADRRTADRFLDELGKTIRAAGREAEPFLLVLDSFEEVQRLSRELSINLWELLVRIQKRIPRLRAVLAGRARLENVEVEALELATLDEAAAVACLRALGVPNDQLAAQVFAVVGGNPLNLRLAAGLVRRNTEEGVEPWEQLEENPSLFRVRLKDEVVRGILYRRILGHIPSDDVRRLAHPGLALRFITPELIRDVLAGPCGVAVRDLGHARALFEALAAETSLVTQESDDVLRHRPDVRRVMLSLLREADPIRSREVDEAAVRYYEQRSDQDPNDLAARAEELYHRLALNQPERVIDSRWRDGVEPFLGDALEEIPPRARVYLGSRIGEVLLDPESLAAEADASLATWERNAERRVRQLLAVGKDGEAIQVLGERDERTPGSPLYLLMARLLVRLGRWPEARAVIRQGIARIYEAGESLADGRDKPRDLLIASALIDEHENDLGSAPNALEHAARLVGLEAGVFPQLLLSYARLRVASHQGVDTRRARLRETASALRRADDQVLNRNPLLARKLAAEMLPEDPEGALQIVGSVDLEPPTKRVLAGLMPILARWAERAGATAGVAASLLRATPKDLETVSSLSPRSGQKWLDLLSKLTRKPSSEVVAWLIRVSADEPRFRRALVELIRGEDDLEFLESNKTKVRIARSRRKK
jgi:hypothetical protein